jgi:hypothetical protein
MLCEREEHMSELAASTESGLAITHSAYHCAQPERGFNAISFFSFL